TEIGKAADGKPPYRVGDPVRKGDLLAVIWSKDLGEKKCELVDALTRLRSEDLTLARLRKLYETGAGTERSVRDAERTVQAARNDVARAERTLRTWRLTDSDIQEVRNEAERLAKLDRGPRPRPTIGPASRCGLPSMVSSSKRTSRLATSSTPPRPCSP